MPDVSIKFAGPGLVPALRVRDEDEVFHRVVLTGGTGTFDATIGESYKLFWLVVGQQNTDYSITLAPPAGHNLAMARNPIKSTVPGGQAGFGREPFVLDVVA